MRVAMAAEAIGTGTLKHVSQLPTGGGPVLSVYLDLDRDQRHGVPGDAELEALVDGIVRAVGLASDQAAEVVVVCHERSELVAHGSIAALLSAPPSYGALPSLVSSVVL
jgi:hypothetical protein